MEKRSPQLDEGVDESLFEFPDEKKLHQMAIVRYRKREIDQTMKDSKNY